MTLDNSPSNSPGNSPDNFHGITMKEAASLVGKSHAMIKVLVANKKILFKKISGKYGDEIRIDANSLKDFYKIKNSVDNTPDNFENINLANSSVSQDNTKDNDMLDKFIEAMETQMSFLYGEVKNKNEEIERLHKLLENQQSLSLQTGNLLKDIQEKLTLESTNTKKEKKFLGIF